MIVILLDESVNLIDEIGSVTLGLHHDVTNVTKLFTSQKVCGIGDSRLSTYKKQINYCIEKFILGS